jgi:hypothetical protein
MEGRKKDEMRGNRRSKWSVLLASLVLPVAAWGADQQQPTKGPGVPGTVNYVEGQATLGGQSLDAKAIGSVIVDPGQSVSTESGKVEVLLTPGVFFRLGSNSAARMVSAGLTNTEMELDRGQAMLEVAELHPENNLRIKEDGLTAKIEKTGLYGFDRDGGVFRVFEGKAEVDTTNGKETVKSGHQLTTGGNGTLMVKKFDKKDYQEGDLYGWSSLRSAYEAEANINEASYYAQYGWMPGGPLWWGAGWYWNPWFSAYTFLPGDGIFYSPFGWGFYSPWWVYSAPFYGYGYGYGHFNHYHHFSTNTATWGPGQHYVSGQHYASGTYNGPGAMSGGAFHSGGHFTGGGGFHASSGGGFHGGGGFGGFHGGGGGFHGGGGSIGGGGHGGR